MKTTIEIENLKCGGCAKSISDGLLSIPGVAAVTVHHDSQSVEITYTNAELLDSLKAKLKQMGYPETGSVAGIESLVTSAKSYVSCAIGKMQK